MEEEIKADLREVSKTVQGVGRMLSSVRILRHEGDPINYEELASLRDALKSSAKTLTIFIKMHHTQQKEEA